MKLKATSCESEAKRFDFLFVDFRRYLRAGKRLRRKRLQLLKNNKAMQTFIKSQSYASRIKEHVVKEYPVS